MTTATVSEPSTSDLYKFLEDAKSSKYLIMDTEGDGKDVRDRGDNPITMGVTLTYRDKNFVEQSYYFAFFHKHGENQPEFFDIVCDLLRTHPCLVMHNAKHDLIAIESWGVFRFHGFWCTMEMAHIINENQLNYKLDHLSKIHGGEPKAMSDMMKRIIDFMGWGSVPSYMMREYSIQDGSITLKLFEKLLPQFFAEGLDEEYWHTQEAWIWTIAQMERVGIRVDKALCESEVEKGEEILSEIKNRLKLNPNSRKDMEELLLKKLNLPVVKRSPKTNEPSFDKAAMEIYEPMLKNMGSEIATDILTYRGWQKVVSTNHKPYLRLQGKDGRIHPNYKIHGTKTRRLSCGADSDGKTEVKSPNLQNIPRASEKPWDGKLKAAFIPEDGFTLWDIDQAQAEMRVGAAYSGDSKLLDIFNSDVNFFDKMAADLGWARQDVKTFVYATGYGAQDRRIADIFGIDLSDANLMRADFNNTYVRYVKLKKYIADRAQVRLHIKYWTGARRHFRTRKEAQHLAFNSLNQGGVAELVKYQAVDIGKDIDWDTCRMLLQVHDSLCFEIKNGHEDEWLPRIKKIMETPPPRFVEKTLVEVPFRVDIKKWGTEEKWQMAA